ncbi:MAG: hypothetical protein D6688_08010 [Alphaproteobacteria bacterium]|nr:MAG: hypothetical protein D6688_08010 [Alphaproteobacteria bacterium]
MFARLIVLAAAAAAMAPSMVAAGSIEKACLKSGRPAASRALCGCIQDAADLTLSRSDQAKAARFFRDPDAAMKVRQSSSGAEERFWERYRAFGDTAVAFCDHLG